MRRWRLGDIVVCTPGRACVIRRGRRGRFASTRQHVLSGRHRATGYAAPAGCLGLVSVAARANVDANADESVGCRSLNSRDAQGFVFLLSARRRLRRRIVRGGGGDLSLLLSARRPPRPCLQDGE